MFNPYSGVKTSILFLDRNLAKRTDEVLFVKVENDGFDLGAQRRPIDKNDLPEALKILIGHKEVQKTQENGISLCVPRKRLLDSADCNLSGDRYRKVAVRADGKWPVLKVGDVCTQILSGGTPSTKVPGYWKGDIPWITSADIQGLNEVRPRKHITREAIKHSATNLIPADNVVVVTRVGLGKILLNPFDLCISQDSQGLVVDRNRIRPAYLAYVLSREVLKFKENSRGSTIQGVVKSQLADLEIPLPPLDEQERIIAELDGDRKVIEGARQVLANYKPTIKIDPEWPVVKLGEACESIMDGTHFSPKSAPSGDYLYITAKNIKENRLDLTDVAYVTKEDHKAIYERCPILKGDVLYIKDGATTGIAVVNPLEEQFSLLSSVAVLRGEPSRLDNSFLCHYLNSTIGKSDMLTMVAGVAITRLTLAKLNSATIPLPPLDIQREIVAGIEAERALVEANRKLVELFEKKIQTKLAEIWGESKTSR